MENEFVCKEDLRAVLASFKGSAKAAGMAAETIFILSSTAAGLRQITEVNSDVCASLLSMAVDEESAHRLVALQALINLSQDPHLRDQLSRVSELQQLLSSLQTSRNQQLRTALLQLLINVSHTEAGSTSVVATHWVFLLDYLKGFSTNEDVICRHVVTLLHNLSRIGAAMEIMTSRPELLDAARTALHCTGSPMAEICLLTLRNILLKATEAHNMEWISAQETLVGKMLHILCDDAQKDIQTSEFRVALAESLLLVGHSKEGLDILWEFGAPELLRSWYEKEDDALVCEAMESLAEIFLLESS